MLVKSQAEERRERMKGIKLFVGVLLAGFFFGSWVATQYIAYRCAYDPKLGYHVAHVYFPLRYHVWYEKLLPIIPNILSTAAILFRGSVLTSFCLALFFVKRRKNLTSYGTATWANAEDIKRSGLCAKHGVICGTNPFPPHKLLRDDDKTHVLLMAPTRSGKGVGVIIPTCLTWKHSLFVTDVKEENWKLCGRFRREVLKQKVLKFDPMCGDGDSARWNPLAEIHFRTGEEYSDIQNIVTMIADPEGKGQLDYWSTTGSALLIGTILHLMYSHQREQRPLPSLSDLAAFLSSAEHTVDEQLKTMKSYPHITPEEFMSDHNILEEIYGEYITDFKPYEEDLNIRPLRTLAELKAAVRKSGRNIDFEGGETRQDNPYRALLVHPRVAQCAAEVQNKAPAEQSGVLSTAKTFLNLYQNPVIAKNVAVSDFCIKDLLNPAFEISVFLVIPPRDLGTLRPLCRLFINTLLRTLIDRMEFDQSVGEAPKAEQRLLLMLDEFPQFGRMDIMETALAVCAGYGIKACVVCQDVNQLNKAYTRENSIAANCGTHIYYAPNLEPEGNTAKAISMTLGKETITVNSQSHNGGLWKSSTSTSQTGRDLMTPDEVMKLPYEKSIIFRTGQKPILADKLFWFDQPYFKRRQLSPALLISDYGTKILTFDDLVNVRGKEVKARQEKKEAIRREKEKCGNKEENVKGKERANLTSLMPTPSEKETSSPDEESSTLMKAAEKTNKDEPMPSRMADRAAAVFAAVNDEPKMYTVETKRWEKAAEPLALQSTFKHLEGEDEMMMDEKEMSQDRAEERADMSDMMDTDMLEDQAFMEVEFDAEEERAFEVPPDFVVEKAEEDAGDEALFED